MVAPHLLDTTRRSISRNVTFTTESATLGSYANLNSRNYLLPWHTIFS